MIYVMASALCNNLAPIIKLIKYGIIPILQIGIPIILIVLGMLDLGKAVMAGKEEEMKKAQSQLLKRAIYAVAVFFVLTIVTVIFSILSSSGASKKSNSSDISSDSSQQSEVVIQEDWITCWNDIKR